MRDSKSGVLAFLLTMIVATAITWVIGLLDIQFKSEATLAFDKGFPGELSDWVPAGDPDNITLSADSIRIDRNTGERSYAMRTFELPPKEQLLNRKLRVRGKILTISRATPIEKERIAAYMIWFLDKDQEALKYLTVQPLTGDFPEYRAERIVSIPDNARFFVTTLINRDSDGAFELIDANVTLVSGTLLYTLISTAMFALWITLLIMAIWWLIRRGNFGLGLSISALLVLTLVGVLLPESATTQYVLPAYQKLAAALSLERSEPLNIIYKAGHFLFFFAVALLLMLNRRTLNLSATLILVFMLVFAVATEGLQLHLFNRSTRLLDLGIDLAGAVMAWLLVMVLQVLFSHKKTTATTPHTG